MSHFIFKAKKAGGAVYKGERDAKDCYELYKMLKESGDEVLSVEEKTKGSFLKRLNIQVSIFGSVKAQEKINFIRNLGSMIKAGLSMSRALSVMERQGKNKNVKKIILTLNEQITKGKTLSEAMAMFPKMFSPLVVSMVRSGEQSGTLAESLRVVALQMEKNFTLERRIRGALMYPGIIFCAMILIAIILLIYVVPTLEKTFSDLHLPLPLSTQFVLFVSDTITNHGIILFLLLIVVGGSYYLWSRQISGKKTIHRAILYIPIIGELVKEVNAARTARALSSLVNSGVDILDALHITNDIVQNVHYKKVLETAAKSVEKGEPLSKTFAENTKLYPLFLGEMMNVGEETGKLGEMLIGVAVYYEDDVDQRTKDMSTIIEPFLMIIIGAVVGFFAIAMISPMYSLANSIS